MFFISSLFAIDVLGELVQGSLENLLYLANLSLTLLLIVKLLVMSLDHVDQLIDVAARHNYIANFLFRLHLLSHHEQVGPVLADHT